MKDDDNAQIVQNVAHAMSSWVEDLSWTMVDRVCEYAESPIELALMAGVLAASNISMRIVPEFPNFAILPQHQWEKYRIDFAIELTKSAPQNNLIFVECDGHDFHERTKEQAKHDRRKDRAIQIAGIPLLRFTGSEIFTDLGSCVKQVVDFVVARDRALRIVP